MLTNDITHSEQTQPASVTAAVHEDGLRKVKVAVKNLVGLGYERPVR